MTYTEGAGNRRRRESVRLDVFCGQEFLFLNSRKGCRRKLKNVNLEGGGQRRQLESQHIEYMMKGHCEHLDSHLIRPREGPGAFRQEARRIYITLRGLGNNLELAAFPLLLLFDD